MKGIKIDTPLFLNSFNVSRWKNQDRIDYLLLNMKKMEDVIEKYLESIRKDFPQLTDHSIDHSKMLWNYANIIIGDKQELNPLEAFILHSAFLVHDAGMCYSVLNNKGVIENDPIYLDFISTHGSSDEIKNEALFYTIRQKHGDLAEKVANDKLRDGEHLIEDQDLRDEFGQMIGKIAKSHTCSINYIEREFGSPYSCPRFPTEWSIDHQKISFVLRVSDAAHLDNLRTPKTLQLISEMEGISKEHWTFQKKLGFPHVSQDNLLIYSPNSTFKTAEQNAWWVCYDALRVLDKELRDANEYFESKGQSGFSVKGVKSINNTLVLGKDFIKTEGWNAIDTTIKVTNPVHIATELGGIKLYGNINIALRELVQNSLDAINLYRFHSDQDNNLNVGEIHVKIAKEGHQHVLTVRDNGIGMSQTLLTSQLLDFGSSYWKSNSFKFEYAGLTTKGFESIGKFGIGFFSVFMLGNNVKVTSWKYGQAIHDMKTLEFENGLFSNPILRAPIPEEKNEVLDRGTVVKIKLENDPYSKDGFIGNSNVKENLLYSLVKYFIPSPNVKITVEEEDGSIRVINPNYLERLDYKEIIDHLHVRNKNSIELTNTLDSYKKLNIHLNEITHEGRTYGKLALLPLIGSYAVGSTAIVISNGIRVAELSDLVGYLYTDDIVTIKRDSYSKIIPFEALTKWAEKQKEMIEKVVGEHLYGYVYGELLMAFNLFDESLPIALSKNNNRYSWFSIKQLRDRLRKTKSITFYQEGHSYATRPANCSGLIYLQHRTNFKSIIRDVDADKIIDYNSLIKKIFEEEWGEFDQENVDLFGAGHFSIDSPYLRIEKYTRRK